MNTLFIGHQIVELASVDSTNSYALKAERESAVSEGALVWAHEQTCGRGQRGNTWESEASQNLTFSIVLRPNLDVNRQYYLTKAVSLGITDYLKTKVPGPSVISIKWPNDIFAGDKKVAGILIENTLQGEFVVSSIIGIGININQTEFGPHLENAGSLSLLAKNKFDLKDCLSGLCESIEPRYLQLKSQKWDLLDSDYDEHLYRKEFLTWNPKGEISGYNTNRS